MSFVKRSEKWVEEKGRGRRREGGKGQGKRKIGLCIHNSALTKAAESRERRDPQISARLGKWTLSAQSLFVFILLEERTE